MILLINQEKELEKLIEKAKFSEMGVWERTHMEEWIAKHPEILGEELLTITTEYADFDKTSKRLDILAMDREGKLVIIELKRDTAEKFVDLQAIHYAAFFSTHTFEDVVDIRAEFTKKSQEEADIEIREFITNDEFHDLDDQPRIILVANEFKEETLAAVLWLRDVGVDITCVKFEAYEVDEKIVVTPNIIVPLPEAKQFMIYREKKSKQSSEKRSTEDYHLRTAPDDIKDLYAKISQNVLNLDNKIRVKPKKWYIAFVSSVSNANFIYAEIYQKDIKIVLNLKKGELNDPEGIAEDVSEKGHRGNGDYRITISPDRDLNYFMTLIKQAYEKYS